MPRIRRAGWMLDALRLSLFGQPLGARGPISVQRIRKQPTTSFSLVENGYHYQLGWRHALSLP
ncbi:MAG: DUF3418 domain-containing protein [Chryseoglobus sp.]|nr:DUF3418 domain-containing protein [Microcella sp.]